MRLFRIVFNVKKKRKIYIHISVQHEIMIEIVTWMNRSLEFIFNGGGGGGRGEKKEPVTFIIARIYYLNIHQAWHCYEMSGSPVNRGSVAEEQVVQEVVEKELCSPERVLG